MSLKALIANIASEMQPFRPFFGLETIAFLRVVKRFEVNYYDAFILVS